MLSVQFLFWYIAHNWNYGILATPARTIVKIRLNTDSMKTYVLLHFEHKNGSMKFDNDCDVFYDIPDKRSKCCNMSQYFTDNDCVFCSM